MKHTISVLVENKFGVLARIAGLFSARGFNIDSLAVGETEDPTVSRMTIVSEGDEKTLEQIKKQLNKLIDVIKVADFKEGEFIDRELMLIKVSVSARTRKDILEAVSSIGAKLVNAGSKSLSIEISSDQNKIKALLELMRPFGIIEVVRTGRIAMDTSEKGLEAEGKP
ncbi:MAG: acetolactate synthase small subunit [Omnitrophica bacterium RIFCSPLOWO2_01_FULL_45_24]|nr:MAG: acetolactate synthase small subunit [Omnitrophica bacterium RIFCSPHIGHO2_02_FULL_46_20]OGW93388.1 MAG: acetolactate synthase small subunit [Omnitrophica bacterium RIFCSPLOWO2_01_FULL_45_24]OGW94393.1 MAG: acetolactate synthase small subunit [Omnitrophica bacterium RIFCSPLOWO2_12_FULL_45_13]